ncbi:hypothetical protein O6H91_02G093400 [Diphasiastrum complanatum]|uniref:Uncharacterized protein n=1 Tax=Diphasiastrum complanatum TaxID=34168 RepID=A0ACC2EIP2_DIPCM|nr:hypothetical protein O6H91_02G093400 [Diphasiastrum complanatum]
MTVWRYLLERLLLAIENPWQKNVGSNVLRPASLEGALLSREQSSVFAEEQEPANAAAEQPTSEDIAVRDNLILKLEGMTCAAQTKDATIADLEKKLQANLEELVSENEKMKLLWQQNFLLHKQLAASHERQRNLEKQIEHMSKAQVILEEAEERLCTQLVESEAEWLEEFHNFKNELVSIHDVLRQKEAKISSLTSEINGLRDVNST